MMGRVLCLLGFHQWGHVQSVSQGFYSTVNARQCRRCGVFVQVR